MITVVCLFCNLHRLSTCCHSKTCLRGLAWCASVDCWEKTWVCLCCGTHQITPLFAGWVSQAHHTLGCSFMCGPEIDELQPFVGGPQRQMDFVSAMGLCCLRNSTGVLQWGTGSLYLMHLMYDAPFIGVDAQCQLSNAGCSQSHLVSSGTNIQRCLKRITRRNVNAFLRQSVFLY